MVKLLVYSNMLIKIYTIYCMLVKMLLNNWILLVNSKSRALNVNLSCLNLTSLVFLDQPKKILSMIKWNLKNVFLDLDQVYYFIFLNLKVIKTVQEKKLLKKMKKILFFLLYNTKTKQKSLHTNIIIIINYFSFFIILIIFIFLLLNNIHLISISHYFWLFDSIKKYLLFNFKYSIMFFHNRFNILEGFLHYLQSIFTCSCHFSKINRRSFHLKLN